MFLRAQCAVCQEGYDNASIISALQCGHCYHIQCLAQWFEEKKSCPTCRKAAVPSQVVSQLYFDVVDEARSENGFSSDSAPAALFSELSALKVKLGQQAVEYQELKEKYDSLNDTKGALEARVFKYKTSVERLKEQEVLLKSQLDVCKTYKSDAEDSRRDASKLRDQLQKLRNLQALLDEASNENELRFSNSTCNGCVQLQNYVVILKKKYLTMTNEKRRLSDDNSKLRTQFKQMEENLERTRKDREALREELKIRSAKRTPCIPRVKEILQDTPTLLRDTQMNSRAKVMKLDAPDFLSDNDLDEEVTILDTVPSTSSASTATVTTSTQELDDSLSNLLHIPLVKLRTNPVVTHRSQEHCFNGFGGHTKRMAQPNAVKPASQFRKRIKVIKKDPQASNLFRYLS